jgi:amidase
MTALHFRSAADLVHLLEQREISAVELLDHFIARVEQHNPALNAVVATDFERARAAAKAADVALAKGERKGRLHGLPMTIKDAYEVAGLRSTGGAPEYADHVPAQHADAVARIEAAGGIVFGKTNVPYLSGDLQSFNAVYGTTNNPWDLARGPGGSSGGAAAALAAGLTGLELGSDIGGSIRTPAHFCGVFGHKPSFGVVSKRGHIPGPPGLLATSDLSVSGPLGRSAADLDLLLDVIAGPSDQEATGWRLELPAPRATNPKGLRVAVWLDEPFCAIDQEMAGLLRNAAEALGAAGAAIDWAARPGFSFAQSTEIYLQLLHSVISAGYPAALRARFAEAKSGLDPEDKSHRALQIRGSAMSHTEWLQLNERRAQLRAHWRDFFRDYDVVLAPVFIRPAFPHDHQPDFHKRRLEVNGVERDYMDALLWAGPAVVSYLPASAAPVGLTTAGLPVGIQIIGPYLEDRTTIAVAGMIESLLGGFRAPPGY